MSKYKRKPQLEAEKIARRQIRDAVREMEQGATQDITTNFSSREMPSIVDNITDTSGRHKCYRCTAIPIGVRVTCTYAFRITAVSVEVR